MTDATPDGRPCKRDGCRWTTINPAGFCSRQCRRMWSEHRARDTPLLDGSWPLPWTMLLPEEVETHRVTWCRRYDACLDYAATAGWNGFSCKRCPVDDEYSEAEKHAELRRILEAATELIQETSLLRRRPQ